jgi:hypothetical protein
MYDSEIACQHVNRSDSGSVRKFHDCRRKDWIPAFAGRTALANSEPVIPGEAGIQATSWQLEAPELFGNFKN